MLLYTLLNFDASVASASEVRIVAILGFILVYKYRLLTCRVLVRHDLVQYAIAGQLMLRIREIPGFSCRLGGPLSLLVSQYFSLPEGKCQNNTLKEDNETFIQILTNSTFAIHTVLQLQLKQLR